MWERLQKEKASVSTFVLSPNRIVIWSSTHLVTWKRAVLFRVLWAKTWARASGNRRSRSRNGTPPMANVCPHTYTYTLRGFWLKLKGSWRGEAWAGKKRSFMGMLGEREGKIQRNGFLQAPFHKSKVYSGCNWSVNREHFHMHCWCTVCHSEKSY